MLRPGAPAPQITPRVVPGVPGSPHPTRESHQSQPLVQWSACRDNPCKRSTERVFHRTSPSPALTRSQRRSHLPPEPQEARCFRAPGRALAPLPGAPSPGAPPALDRPGSARGPRADALRPHQPRSHHRPMCPSSTRALPVPVPPVSHKPWIVGRDDRDGMPGPPWACAGRGSRPSHLPLSLRSASVFHPEATPASPPAPAVAPAPEVYPRA